MERPTVVVELAADVQHARDLSAGGIFVPGCALALNSECDLVVRSATAELRFVARIVFLDPRAGAGLELVGFGPEMKAQLAGLMAVGGDGRGVPAPRVAPEAPDTRDEWSREWAANEAAGTGRAHSGAPAGLARRAGLAQGSAAEIELRRIVRAHPSSVAQGSDAEIPLRGAWQGGAAASQGRSRGVAQGSGVEIDLGDIEEVDAARFGERRGAAEDGDARSGYRFVDADGVELPTGAHGQRSPYRFEDESGAEIRIDAGERDDGALGGGGGDRDDRGAGDGEARRAMVDAALDAADEIDATGALDGLGALDALGALELDVDGLEDDAGARLERGDDVRDDLGVDDAERRRPGAVGGPGSEHIAGVAEIFDLDELIDSVDLDLVSGERGGVEAQGEERGGDGGDDGGDDGERSDVDFGDLDDDEDGADGADQRDRQEVDEADGADGAEARGAAEAGDEDRRRGDDDGGGDQDHLGSDGAGGPAPRRAAANVHERLRHLPLAQQLKKALTGELQERIVLERMYGKTVWEALLRNPRLTAPEVARIARMGTLPRTLLELIVNNGAWLQIPEVRRALLSNRRMQTDQILRVLRLLPKHELRLAAVQTAYPHPVRDAAKRMLKELP